MSERTAIPVAPRTAFHFALYILSHSKDYYAILDLSEDEEGFHKRLQMSYRKLARRCPPDKGGDGAAFEELNNAKFTLQDPRRKSIYDSYRDLL